MSDETSKIRLAVNDLFNKDDISAIIWEKFDGREYCAVILNPSANYAYVEYAHIKPENTTFVSICRFCRYGVKIEKTLVLTCDAK